MADLEEVQYMDLAAAGADDRGTAAPMARSSYRRSTAGMRRRGRASPTRRTVSQSR